MKTIALTFALLLVSATASATDAAKLEPWEQAGYFDKSGRLGAYYWLGRGTRPNGNGFGAGGDFERRGYGLDFDLYGYWDATRFDTLIGAELSTKLGFNYREKLLDPPADAPEPSENKFFFRIDGALDYGLVHWGGNLKGRIAGGAGFGCDFDPTRSYALFRSYPLLLARVQLWPGDAFSLNGAYHYVPATGSGKLSIREHRLEGSLGVSSIQVGLRITLTTARDDARPDEEPYSAREGSAFVAYAF